jgi:hypothetical protein
MDYGADIVSGIISAAAVAPFISIVDKAIFVNASGKEKLLVAIINGTRLLANPLVFLRQPSFLCIWGVYAGTYCAANTTHTLCSKNDTPWQIPKFVASSTANVSLSILKDIYFTRAFGTVVKPVPKLSVGLYGVRDSLSVFATFNLPPIVAAKLQDMGYDKNTSRTASQLLIPCLVQPFSVPLHLYGMNLYNQSQASFSERMEFMKREYTKTCVARICRIFPAFGIGGVLNNYLLDKLK